MIRRAIRRSRLIRSAAVLGSLLCVAPILTGCGEWRKWEHRQERRQIERHVQAAMRNSPGASSNTMPFAKLDDANARWEILRAISTALGNHFYYDRAVDPKKFNAVVVRLDRTNGRDLESVQGCLLIMDLLEQASPSARDYAWFAQIHEAQEAGNIPRLDRSKIFD